MPGMKPDRVLAVEPDPKFSSLVRQVLLSGEYGVLAATNGERAIQMTAQEQPDLVLLELTLPGELTGFDVIHRIREFSEVPILILSVRTDPEDMVRGFDLGADDYITKPFHARLLLARIRAVLKRWHRTETRTPLADIVCDRLIINLPCRKVTVDDVEIYLTETEYNLLLELAKHSNQVLTHQQLLTAVWGTDYRFEVDYLRSYIHILRRKLESNPANPKIILSKQGVGYMVVSGQSEASGDRSNGR